MLKKVLRKGSNSKLKGLEVNAQNVVVKPYNKNLNSCIFDLSGFLHNILSIYG